MLRAAFVLGALALAGCQDPSGPESDIDGEQLYQQYCARCHGAQGEGVVTAGATTNRLDDPVVMRALSDDQVMGVIRMGRAPKMPGFGRDFTEAKMMVITAYVRSLPERKQLPALVQHPRDAEDAAKP